jgi:hypothetical protein
MMLSQRQLNDRFDEGLLEASFVGVKGSERFSRPAL